MKRLVVAMTAMLALAASAPAFVDSRPSSGSPGQQAPAAKQAAPALTPAELDTLLAPIALYPDQLLAPMLMSASNPGKIATLAEWMRSQKAAGTELQDAAAKAGFDDSLVALVLFPDVLNRLASQPDWTALSARRSAATRRRCSTASSGSVRRPRPPAR